MAAWKVYFPGFHIRSGDVIAAHHCRILRGNSFRSICSVACSRAWLSGSPSLVGIDCEGGKGAVDRYTDYYIYFQNNKRPEKHSTSSLQPFGKRRRKADRLATAGAAIAAFPNTGMTHKPAVSQARLASPFKRPTLSRHVKNSRTS